MTPAARPAETGGIAAALALLIAHMLGVDDAGTIAALALVVGFVPAAITWAVAAFRKKPGP